MEDPEVDALLERFLGNQGIDDGTKIYKLRQLLLVFAGRWTEERTLSCVGLESNIEIPRQML